MRRKSRSVEDWNRSWKRLQLKTRHQLQFKPACRVHIIELERTIDNLKLADAFKSGNADNTEARKKIDKLIKEIDKCITLMEG